MDALSAHGWDVVGFEGPGQGGALEEAGLAFVVEWERPVAAVVDYYGLTEVTLLGISLGGGLAVRAAAFEPRVRRVICDVALFDFLDASLRQVPVVLRGELAGLVAARADSAADALVHRAMRHSPVLEWGCTKECTSSVSTALCLLEGRGQVPPDGLLRSGARRHPAARRSRRSLHSAAPVPPTDGGADWRTVGQRPHPDPHRRRPRPLPPIGNIGLSVDLITGWLDQMVRMDNERARQPNGTLPSAEST